MKTRLLLLTTLLLQFLSAFPQTTPSKADQVKRIREVYANAKKLVAANGKEGKAPQDMTITLNDGTQIDEDFIINEETELKFYFKQQYEPTSSDVDPTTICYFLTEEFTAHGHLRNRELLFDPEEGYLLFAFHRTETDAGYVIESRYYFDKTGQIIEQKHKSGGKDVKPEDYSMFDGTEELHVSKQCLGIFESLVNDNGQQTTDNGQQPDLSRSKSTKADRMKMIRSTYSEAKDMVAKNSKSALPRDMRIVIHKQLSDDYPPVTDDIKFYFEPDRQRDEPFNHCYFISEQHSSMYFKEYNELLFAPDSHKLIFSFSQVQEEGETYEWRYYYDENGKCIDTKVKSPDAEDTGDSGVGDKERFSRYMKVFQLIANTPFL